MTMQLRIPWAKGSHTSRKAAEAQARNPRRGVKVMSLITAYRTAGEDGLTDAEMVQATGMLLQSVCSCRNTLMEQGLVGRGCERMGAHCQMVNVYFWIGPKA